MQGGQGGPRLGVILGSHATHGVMVQSVSPDTPAQHAGIQSGDQIVAINGQHVFSNRDVVNAIQQSQGPVNLAVLRNGQMMQLQTVLAHNMGPNFHPGMFNERPALGVLVQQNGPQDVRIANVVPGGPAQQAGIQPGDRILGIADQQIVNADQVVHVVGQVPPGQSLPIHLERNGEQGTIWIHPENADQVFQGQGQAQQQNQDFNR